MINIEEGKGQQRRDIALLKDKLKNFRSTEDSAHEEQEQKY